MVKRKNKSKRSLGSLPKGLPSKKTGVNPFESAGRHSSKRAKHAVANDRPVKPTAQQGPSALARSLQSRQTVLRDRLQSSKKANVFTDRRIGEYDGGMTADEKNLARLVRERSSRSKRSSKFNLNEAAEGDDGAAELTHKGRKVDAMTARDHVILSDDEDDIGNLDAADTALHFGGGGGAGKSREQYGPSDGNPDMGNAYASRKMELDDLIKRRKLIKAEKMKSSEEQVETVDKMDHSFKELAALLSFRDKERDIKDNLKAKRAGTLAPEDQEMADWDREMKQYQFMERKVQATDRTKPPEEIAKEEADRLHELETRRLARMNGDFDDDNFSDIESGDEDDGGKKKRKRKKARQDQPEALDGSDDDEPEDELQTRFTSEGVVQVNKDGVIVNDVGKKAEQHSEELLEVGSRVTSSYRATEQYGGQESWFNGVILQVNANNDGSVTYNVEYEDGDFEDGVQSHHIRPIDKTKEELTKEAEKKAEEIAHKSKRLRAKDKARYVYIGEVIGFGRRSSFAFARSLHLDGS
jgi:nucleolar protein 14